MSTDSRKDSDRSLGERAFSPAKVRSRHERSAPTPHNEMPLPDPTRLADFQNLVWRYYDAHGRHDLPWRQPHSSATPGIAEFDPFAIMVSEIMLQQTQVGRVVPKFIAFMAALPTVGDLAKAPLAAVLHLWSGLGYNRRAKFLWQAANVVVRDFAGVMPASQAELMRLPGVGANTAGAIMAYAFNEPVSFIETNIRSVFIYHFFAEHDKVSDADIMQVVQAALPPEQTYREWYWALMDYGTYLKQTVGNHARQSSAYSRQSKFEGSRRQVRGNVLRVLGDGPLTKDALLQAIVDERLESVLTDLRTENMIELKNKHYQLTGA